MNAREREAALLLRCREVATGQGSLAQDSREANVFVLSAMLLQFQFPVESSRLKQAGEDYLAAHPTEKISPDEIVRKGWIVDFPRMREGLRRVLGAA